MPVAGSAVPERFVDRAVSALLIAVPIAFAGLSLALGQDTNWDLRNYHWYNPYAYLNGHFTRDLGVAHVATFYNPLLDIPTYIVGRAAPAPVVGAILGFIHGLNFVLLFTLSRRLLDETVPHWRPTHRRVAAAFLSLIGVTGAGYVALVGTTYNDNVVSLGVLGALLMIVNRASLLRAPAPLQRRDWLYLAGAGLLLGAVIGLKLTTVIYAVGACVALLCAGAPFRRGLTAATVCGIGIVVGYLVTGGPWMWFLWDTYRNPLFPYFNSVFHGPMGLATSYRDLRFVPTTVPAFFAFPFIFSDNSLRVGEVVFRDYRVLAAYLLLIATAVVARVFPGRGAPRPVTRVLIAFAVVSYFVWLKIFAIYRYLLPVEMLVPLLVAAALTYWPGTLKVRAWAAASLLVALTIVTRPGDWAHEPWQSGPFVTATPPAIAHPDQTLAIVAGFQPVGWLVAFFPPQIPFIRIQGFLNGPDQPPNGLNDAARARIMAHTGDLFLLDPDEKNSSTPAALAAYGLRADFGACVKVVSNLADYARWCPVSRVSAPSLPQPAGTP
jgi:hypothetical protein